MRALWIAGLLALGTPGIAAAPMSPDYLVAVRLMEGRSTIGSPRLVTPSDQAVRMDLPDGFGDLYTLVLAARPQGTDGRQALLRFRLERRDEPVGPETTRRAWSGAAVVPVGHAASISVDGGRGDDDALRMDVTVTTAPG